MTIFEHNNLPIDLEIITPLDDKHFAEALDILQSALTWNFTAREAKIATVYERNGYMEMDPIIGKSNQSYNPEDDVVVQITVRFPKGHSKSPFTNLQAVLVGEHETALSASRTRELEAIEAEQTRLAARKAELLGIPFYVE